MENTIIAMTAFFIIFIICALIASKNKTKHITTLCAVFFIAAISTFFYIYINF